MRASLHPLLLSLQERERRDAAPSFNHLGCCLDLQRSSEPSFLDSFAQIILANFFLFLCISRGAETHTAGEQRAVISKQRQELFG